MPSVEWTFNLGTIVTLIFVAGGFYFVTKAELAALRADLRKLNDVITDLAVQNNRLDNQDNQLNQLREEIRLLRRGQGYIQRDVDGEYGPYGHLSVPPQPRG